MLKYVLCYENLIDCCVESLAGSRHYSSWLNFLVNRNIVWHTHNGDCTIFVLDLMYNLAYNKNIKLLAWSPVNIWKLKYVFLIKDFFNEKVLEDQCQSKSNLMYLHFVERIVYFKVKVKYILTFSIYWTGYHKLGGDCCVKNCNLVCKNEWSIITKSYG